MNGSAARGRLSARLPAALLGIALSFCRASHLDAVAGSYTGCSGCFFWPTLAQDAWTVAALLVLLGLGALCRRGVPRRLFDVAALLLLAGMTLDVVLLKLLMQRFYLADLLRFSANPLHALDLGARQLLSADGLPYALFVLAALAIGVLLLTQSRHARGEGRALLGCAAGALLGALLGAHFAPLRYVHANYSLNLFAANRPPGRARAFSSDYAARQRARADALPRTCTQETPGGNSVVLVLTESLSAYQSALLGGPEDWLPGLDALARENHYFTHFYANGFGTDGGEIAALTGRLPLAPPGAEWYALPQFGAADDTLVGVAHRAGYSAHYFTTADLGFLDSGAWLNQLGFDSVEGNEAPFYRDLPRVVFGAAEDAALFARFEQWLDRRTDPRPFVAVLLTVSSHPPFVEPHTRALDAGATLHYVDSQLVQFERALAARGFLAHGVLAITGDHRSMTPLEAEETRRFGSRAFARIPLVVAGAVDLPARVDAAFQQSDLPGSIAQLLGVQHCRSAFAGTLLAAPLAPPRYVLHARGDERDRVDVYFDGGEADYELDGDASGWRGPAPPDAADVAVWIDAQRLRNAGAGKR